MDSVVQTCMPPIYLVTFYRSEKVSSVASAWGLTDTTARHTGTKIHHHTVCQHVAVLCLALVLYNQRAVDLHLHQQGMAKLYSQTQSASCQLARGLTTLNLLCLTPRSICPSHDGALGLVALDGVPRPLPASSRRPQPQWRVRGREGILGAKPMAVDSR